MIIKERKVNNEVEEQKPLLLIWRVSIFEILKKGILPKYIRLLEFYIAGIV
jgi:hypothetical protein